MTGPFNIRYRLYRCTAANRRFVLLSDMADRRIMTKDGSSVGSTAQPASGREPGRVLSSPSFPTLIWECRLMQQPVFGGFRTDTVNPGARDLYLDLLCKSLSNLIYGPFPQDHWNDGLFRHDAIPGRDRQSPAHTMVGVLRLANLRALTQRVIDLGIPGDLIETGVWRGGCCILMRGVLAANSIRDRKVYVADSFEGLPPPNPHLFPQDTGDTLHTIPELAVLLDQVKAKFRRYDLLDDQVVFVKGFFSDTLPSIDAKAFSLIRLDGDMYESAYVALENLYPRLSIGGFVIIDDYGAIEQCRKAVTDYRNKLGITERIQQSDWTEIWWQKTD
jgi:O-methyltransferase